MTQEQGYETVEDKIEATIKPCPRCGGKGELTGTLDSEVYCEQCGFWTGGDYDTLEEAIEWWNEQPYVDDLTAQLAQVQVERDALRAELRECRARLSGTEAAWEDIEDMMMLRESEGDDE